MLINRPKRTSAEQGSNAPTHCRADDEGGRYAARMAGTRRRWWPSIAAILVVVGFGLYLWAWIDAHQAFSEIQVVGDATPLQCSGIEPGEFEREIDTSSTFSLYRIELRRTMECRIEFHLRNTGTRSVDVDQAVVPFGRAGAQGALAVRIEPNSLAPRDWGPANDAAFDLDISLQPDEERTFTLHVAYQDGLCFDNGAAVLFDDYVRVQLSRWLFSGQAGTELLPIAFTGTEDTQGCTG